MVLLAAVAAGLVLTLWRARLTGRTLKPIHLKASWLVFAAVVPQILIFQIPAVGGRIPADWAPIVLVASQALLMGFALLNLSTTGMAVLGIGLLANFLAILFNGGWMPISPETVHRILPALPDDYPLVDRRLGLSKDWIFAAGEVRMPWLADQFVLPGPVLYQFAFSVGDVLIAIGAFTLLWSLSNPEMRRQNGFTESL